MAKGEIQSQYNQLSVVIALVAGLAGGAITRYIAPTPVFAQASNAQAEVPAAVAIRTHSITLVDVNDRPVGTFMAERVPGYRPGGPMRIVLRDANQRDIWSAPGSVRLLPESSK